MLALMWQFSADSSGVSKIIQLSRRESMRLGKLIGTNDFEGGWGLQMMMKTARSCFPDIKLGIMRDNDICLIEQIPKSLDQFLVIIGQETKHVAFARE